uniref:Keratin-associated protein 29-1 n=1 Tax=Sus scrofa TaxID=9823 RepID=A0A8D1NRM3_PIG
MQPPGKVSTGTMVDNCCPGNAAAIPAVPTISICPKDGSFRDAICLPSSCRSRTWQLVTCQENCQPCSSAPSGCEPTPCQPPCLPATSCVGFVCQPICSCTTCYGSGTGQSPCPVSSCLESTSGTLHCQPAPSISFVCQPVANCQPPCSVKNPYKPASCGTVSVCWRICTKQSKIGVSVCSSVG